MNKRVVKYNHKLIEKRWQNNWLENNLYSTDLKNAKNKFYNLWMFPYPSAEGLHAGHSYASTGSDVYGRFMRMNNYDVFQPIGYDSFGIHSENYAIKINEHPSVMIDRTTSHYESQMKSLGHGYDWRRTLTTSDPSYYKWTQWLFVQIFKAGLAYKKKANVNFCPGCKTVLADEQIMSPREAGKIPPIYKSFEEIPEGTKVCERCGNIPEIKELYQWFFRITDYAEKLLNNLDKLKWSTKVLTAQREWIGKKTGINITYSIKNSEIDIVCFTTRPETNYGATFIAVSPEYAKDNLIKLVSDDYRTKVKEYISNSLSKTDQQRKIEKGVKTGEFTGLYAINRLNGYEIPIYVSDYVLSDFGTGAVVGVPGHDKRDFEFAQKFGISVVPVISSKVNETLPIVNKDQVYEGDGKIINSEIFNGLDSREAAIKIINYLEDKKWGKKNTMFHLRDWLISRQRYWGPPIPMIHCAYCKKNKKSYLTENKSVLRKDISDWDHYGWYPEENLPVLLPNISDYKPKGDGKGPLANHPEFYNVKCPHCGKKATRETDVSDTFLDSSWYFLRYPSVNSKMPWDKEITKKWLPVDLYFGGAEHAVLHLMYARFVWMVFCDLGYFNFPASNASRSDADWDEPFPNFFAHGLMIKDGAKMSKSKGNVVNPDVYIDKYGSDTLRMYLMFMGPMDGSPDFRDTGIEGMRRFVERFWQIYVNYDNWNISSEDNKKLKVILNRVIYKITSDIKQYKYNTAISKIMEVVNFLKDSLKENRQENNFYDKKETFETILKLAAPFMPHITEEIWKNILKNNNSIHISSWPKFDNKYLHDERKTIPVTINGKVRAQIEVDSDKSDNEKAVRELALENMKVKEILANKSIVKVIFVPSKLINFVTSD